MMEANFFFNRAPTGIDKKKMYGKKHAGRLISWVINSIECKMQPTEVADVLSSFLNK